MHILWEAETWILVFMLHELWKARAYNQTLMCMCCSMFMSRTHHSKFICWESSCLYLSTHATLNSGRLLVHVIWKVQVIKHYPWCMVHEGQPPVTHHSCCMNCGRLISLYHHSWFVYCGWAHACNIALMVQALWDIHDYNSAPTMCVHRVLMSIPKICGACMPVPSIHG